METTMEQKERICGNIRDLFAYLFNAEDPRYRGIRTYYIEMQRQAQASGMMREDADFFASSEVEKLVKEKHQDLVSRLD